MRNTGWEDSIDPNTPPPWPEATGGPNDPDDEDCSTTTYESCRELCTQSPTLTCTSSCSDVASCTPTSGFPETVTLATAVGNSRSSIVQTSSSGPFTETVSSAQSAISYLSSRGDWDFGATTTQESSTTEQESSTSTQEYAYPTGTDIYDVEAECYSDYDEVEGRVEFSADNSFEATVGFCLEEYALRPDDSPKRYGYDSGEYWTWAVMGWAENQSGCGEKETHYPSGDTGESFNGCLVAFELILQDCEGPGYESDEDVYLGGGWVLNTGSGCVLVTHYGTTERGSFVNSRPKDSGGPQDGETIRDMWGFDTDNPKRRPPTFWNVTLSAK